MARTPAETAPTQPDHQQMDRSNDPAERAAMDEAAPEQAMASRRQRLTGSATGVGSVGYDEDGAFDVGDPDNDPREGL
ncbi:MAG TPA: Tat pathway signal protein [Brevundimonas sp.]|nr:Tat pathway signal protein [Brevundimonas sp.]